MASTAPSGWGLLKTTSSSKSKKQKTCPKLFYNFSATPKDGIILFLTDLISLWRCDVSREQIISTSSEQHASIDPSENTEQMRIFLGKIALSLHKATNYLAKDSPKATDLGSLILRTSIDLPKPLKPLEWTFTLSPQPASALAEHILRPALHQSSICHEKIESMLDIIKEKDHVIERLLDRVAEKGVDMSLIFPTLTGITKRGGTGVKVDDAKRLVPGMKVFRRDEWETKFQQDGLMGTEIGLSELVKGCEKCFDHSEEDHSQAMSSWVQKLPSVESLANGSSRSFMNKSQSQSQSQLQGDEETESENQFETQATPPQLNKKRRTPDTNDSDDSDMMNGQPDAKRLKAENSKIGALGRKSRSKTPITQTQADSSSPVQPAQLPQPLKRKKSDASAATETASESDNEAKPNITKQSPSKPSRLGSLKPSASKSPQPQQTSSPSRPQTAVSHSPQPRKLGRIGKNRQRTVSPIPSSTAQSEDNNTEVLVKSSQPTPSTPSRKLGRIGLRNKQTSPTTNDTKVPASPPSTRTRQNETLSEMIDTTSPSPSPSGAERNTSTGSPVVARRKGRAMDTSRHNQLSKDLDSSSQVPNRAAELDSKVISSADDGAKVGTEVEEEAVEETEAQKVSRRRDELKRNIAIGGVKKKRRF